MTIEEAEQIIKDLRAENAKRRTENNELKQQVADANAEKDKAESKLKEVEAKSQEELVKVKDTHKQELEKVTNDHKAELEKVKTADAESKKLAEVTKHALKEGLMDDELVKLMDLSKVTIKEDGKIEGVEAAVKAFKESKPTYFGKVKTSNTEKTPKPATDTKVDAKELKPDEYKDAKKNLLANLPT